MSLTPRAPSCGARRRPMERLIENANKQAAGETTFSEQTMSRPSSSCSSRFSHRGRKTTGGTAAMGKTKTVPAQLPMDILRVSTAPLDVALDPTPRSSLAAPSGGYPMPSEKQDAFKYASERPPRTETEFHRNRPASTTPLSEFPVAKPQATSATTAFWEDKRRVRLFNQAQRETRAAADARSDSKETAASSHEQPSTQWQAPIPKPTEDNFQLAAALASAIDSDIAVGELVPEAVLEPTACNSGFTVAAQEQLDFKPIEVSAAASDWRAQAASALGMADIDWLSDDDTPQEAETQEDAVSKDGEEEGDKDEDAEIPQDGEASDAEDAPEAHKDEVWGCRNRKKDVHDTRDAKTIEEEHREAAKTAMKKYFSGHPLEAVRAKREERQASQDKTEELTVQEASKYCEDLS